MSKFYFFSSPKLSSQATEMVKLLEERVASGEIEFNEDTGQFRLTALGMTKIINSLEKE